MQHHGAPTRLLDFTRSFYVAAFFAANAACAEFSVWAIERRPIDEHAHSFFGNGRALDDEFPPDDVVKSYEFDAKVIKLANEALWGRLQRPSGVFCLDSFHVHARQYIQQACFLCPMTPNAPFEVELASTLGLDKPPSHEPEIVDVPPGKESWPLIARDSVLRFDFASTLRLDVLKDLWSMNICDATLFPGLDGLARSVRCIIDAAGYDPIATGRFWDGVFLAEQRRSQ